MRSLKKVYKKSVFCYRGDKDMASTDKSEKKQAFLMKFAKILFEPEITYENETKQNNMLREPCVIICNHSRRTRKNRFVACDGAMIRCVFNNKNVCSLMAADLMEKPLFKAVVSGCDCIPVFRNAASTEWIHKCKEKLDEGKSVIIFPEGTTLKEKDIEPFKAGFVLLAKIADVKILPMAIGGVYQPLAKNKLKIKVGVPRKLDIQNSTPAGLEKEAHRFQNMVEDMFLSLNDGDIKQNDSFESDKKKILM